MKTKDLLCRNYYNNKKRLGEFATRDQGSLNTSTLSLAMTFWQNSSYLSIYRNLYSVFKINEICSEKPLAVSSGSLLGFLSLHYHST